MANFRLTRCNMCTGTSEMIYERADNLNEVIDIEVGERVY